MANTKKTTTSPKVVESVDTEKEELKKQLADQQKQISELLGKIEMMSGMMSNQSAVATPAKRSNKMIKFINMTAGTVVLKGSRIWTINGQFNSQMFSESEAVAICTNMSAFIRSGAVFIDDAEFVSENELQDSYNYILSCDTMKGFFAMPSDVAVKLYASTSDEQKKIIVDMIMQKMQNGEEVDANIVKKIGELCGKDLINIEPDGE